MIQMARRLTDCEDGILLGKRYLILDRDMKYSPAFRDFMKREGIEVIRLPPRSPNLKAYASHCTSFERIGVTVGNWRRAESLVPMRLVGGVSPGGSYRHSFLSL